MHQAYWAGAAHVCVHMSKEHILLPHVKMGPPMCTCWELSPMGTHTCRSKQVIMHVLLTRYMERSIRRELCSWSRSLTKRSF